MTTGSSATTLDQATRTNDDDPLAEVMRRLVPIHRQAGLTVDAFIALL